MHELGFGQSVRKLPKNKKQVLFYETYFKDSNIDWKPLVCAQHNIIMKFGQKKNKRTSFREKCTKIAKKIKNKCYFTKHTSKRVISTRNPLFSPKIR